MKHLIKYELRKTVLTKIVLAAIALLLEILFLFGLHRNDLTQQTITFAILVLLAAFGIVFIGIQSLTTLHRDMNTRQGYMLFMTPNSCYRILGAKVIENTCSTILIGAAFFLLGTLNYSLMSTSNQDLTDIVELFRDILSAMGASLNFSLKNIIIFLVYLVFNWLATIMVACFADILVSSVLNGKKFSVLLGILLFLALEYGLSELGKVLPQSDSMAKEYVHQIIYNAVIAIVTCIGSAKLMEKCLSV